jgi:hypothetical protein
MQSSANCGLETAFAEMRTQVILAETSLPTSGLLARVVGNLP